MARCKRQRAESDDDDLEHDPITGRFVAAFEPKILVPKFRLVKFRRVTFLLQIPNCAIRCSCGVTHASG